jgi:polyisoprenoid-binding protein YceI
MTKLATLPALTAAALLLPACTQILQAAWVPPTHDPAKVKAGTYNVEPYHTQVLFSVLHFGFTNYYGNFSNVTGTLSVVPKTPSAMVVNISVPVSSVSTTSTKLDEELKSADWLDAAHYPNMVFRSTSVTPTGPTTADVAGTLTLHGVTKPLVLHATFNGAGVNMLDGKETIGFQLSGSLKRSAFGVTKYVPVVSDDVTLMIAAAFEKA